VGETHRRELPREGGFHPPYDTRSDAGAASRVAAVVASNLELTASERAVFVMTATPGLGVVPEAWGSDEGASVGTTSPIVRHDPQKEVATLPLETFPGFLPQLAEDAVERGVCDDQAAGATVVAGVDHREPA
jgi:hypothetical protein